MDDFRAVGASAFYGVARATLRAIPPRYDVVCALDEHVVAVVEDVSVVLLSSVTDDVDVL